MRTLKESWKEAPQAIEELEKDGEVYVTRTLKDGQLRMVFWNEIKPEEEGAGMIVEKGPHAQFTTFLIADLLQNSSICGIHLTYRMRWTY